MKKDNFLALISENVKQRFDVMNPITICMKCPEAIKYNQRNCESINSSEFHEMSNLIGQIGLKQVKSCSIKRNINQSNYQLS